jgi:prolyl-tRNA synthetase
VEAGKAVLVRRDTGEKIPAAFEEIPAKVESLLADIQANLYNKALEFRKANTVPITAYAEFLSFFNEKDGGFAECGWCGGGECETKIKNDTKATIRVLPFGNEEKVTGSCIACGKEAKHLAVFAKSY